MKLTALIKAFTDILSEVGDCDVYVTTKNETQLYNALLFEYIDKNKYLEKPILRLEAIEADDYEEVEFYDG